jgi:hypothetical protein
MRICIYACTAGSSSARSDRCGELCKYDQWTLLLPERASPLDRLEEVEQPGTWSRFTLSRSRLHMDALQSDSSHVIGTRGL